MGLMGFKEKNTGVTDRYRKKDKKDTAKSTVKNKQKICERMSVSSAALCIIFCMTSMSFVGCGESAPAPALLEPVKVSLSGRIAQREDICDIKAYAGSVKPYAVSYAFPDACLVEKISVRLGEYVEEGQVLAVMNCSDDERQRQQLGSDVAWLEKEDECLRKMDEADITVAQMQLSMAISESKDTKEEKKAIEDMTKALQADKEEAEYESSLRQIAIEEKREQLSSYARKTENACLTAKESGYVVYVKEFSADNAAGSVEAEEIVVLISDKQQAYISADIVDAKVKKATEIYAEVDGKKYELEYLPYSDQERRIAINAGISLEARFGTKDGAAMAELIGKNATVYLLSNQKEQVICVAPDSLFSENGEYFVYVLENGQKIKKSVTPGIHTVNEVEIEEGLMEGENVYYPINDMPGNKHTIEKAKESTFEIVKKYDQTNTKQTSSLRVLVKPENAVLQELKVKNGMEVAKGDTIAILSAGEGESRNEAYMQELEELKASYVFQRTLDNKEAGKREKRISAMIENKTQNTFEYKKTVQELNKIKLSMEMEDARYQYETETLKRNIEKAGEQSGVIEVKAEAAGIVTEVTASSEGYSIPKDTLLCKIADPSSLCIMVYTDDKEVVPMDREVTVDLYQTEEDLQGQVISSYQDAAKTVYNEKRVLRENNPQMTKISYIALEEGMSYESVKAFGVNVILWSVPNAIIIDTRAIYNENDRRYVWLMEEGQMKKQYITMGYNEGNSAWIIQGLSAGQEIIVEN
jgi:multidrug efflux pump subunit AcrA (membrane-fusion protein)